MKGRQGLIISLALGLIVAAMVYSHLKSKEKVLLHQGQMVEVIEAARDILQYERVDESMLTVREYPRTYVQPEAFVVPPPPANKFQEAVSQVTAVSIKRGEQLLRTKLFSFGLETGLALKVPPGSRALSLFVTDVSGVAGLVRAGNNVDIYGTFDIREGEERVSATELLLQAAPVLAVERRMTAITPEELEVIEAERERQERKGEAGHAQTGRQQYPENVTVAVSPEQAARLITAQESGTLTLVLRSQYETQGDVKVGQATTNDLLGKGKAVPRAAPAPSWREIRGTEVYSR